MAAATGGRYISPEAIRALADTGAPTGQWTATAGPADKALSDGDVTRMIGS